MQGEALAGCRLAITEIDLVQDLDIPTARQACATAPSRRQRMMRKGSG
jgi:hypothetical protein